MGLNGNDGTVTASLSRMSLRDSVSEQVKNQQPVLNDSAFGSSMISPFQHLVVFDITSSFKSAEDLEKAPLQYSSVVCFPAGAFVMRSDAGAKNDPRHPRLAGCMLSSLEYASLRRRTDGLEVQGWYEGNRVTAYCPNIWFEQ